MSQTKLQMQFFKTVLFNVFFWFLRHFGHLKGTLGSYFWLIVIIANIFEMTVKRTISENIIHFLNFTLWIHFIYFSITVISKLSVKITISQKRETTGISSFKNSFKIENLLKIYKSCSKKQFNAVGQIELDIFSMQGYIYYNHIVNSVP